MPNFRYKAYTAAGDVTEGDIEASSSAAAVEALHRRGLVPFATGEAGARSSDESIWNRELFGSGGLGRQALAAFTRELATLIGARLPLDEALRIAATQTRNKKLRKLANALLARILDGDALSQALAAEGETFPAHYVSVVRAGEISGTLEETFAQLADHLERQAEVRAKIQSALIYPFILLAMAVVAFAVIVAVLIPQLAPLFEGTGRTPPFAIRLFEDMSRSLEANWMIWTGGAVAAAGALAAALRDARVIHVLHRIKLKAPVFGATASGFEAALFARTLGALLKGGVSLLPALEIVETVSKNRAVRDALGRVVRDVREGAPLHRPLRDVGVYPDFAVRLVEIGEKAGRLDEMLLHAARIFETQVQRQVDRLMSLLTPMLTLAIGLGVGGLMMSVMNAILSVNDLAL